MEVLADQTGNRWSRWLAPSGSTKLQYSTTVICSDSSDPVLPSVRQCPIQALPIDTYRFLNPSPYCDTAELMQLAWATFGGVAPGWPLVQAICDWVHGQIRFDYEAVRPHKTASGALADGAGVCRDFAHLAITLCRCLNIPARYCTGYLGYTGIPIGEAPLIFPLGSRPFWPIAGTFSMPATTSPQRPGADRPWSRCRRCAVPAFLRRAPVAEPAGDHRAARPPDC